MADDKKGEGGSVMGELWWIILAVVVLGAAWVSLGGPAGSAPSPLVDSPLTVARGSRSFIPLPSASAAWGGVANRSSRLANKSAVPPGPRSPYVGQVLLSQGTASGADRTVEEYVLLQAPETNAAPITITGWSLKNARDQKYTLKNNKFVAGTASVAVIGQGALLFSPANKQVLAPIVLNPGDTAYVITGAGPNRSPYPVTVSFKNNKCFGYVEAADKYTLTPRAFDRRACPAPESELAEVYRYDECQDFIARLPVCEIPEVKNPHDGPRTINGDEKVPRVCSEPALERLNYPSCFARHLGDSDFLGNEWYVYLNQRWELWDRDEETITLYDAQGRVVAQQSY